MGYHEEQEQLEELKAWWKQYGNAVIWVLIVALLVFAGWNGWRYYQRKQAAEASVLYGELQQSIAAKNQPMIIRISGDMGNKFGRTAYAEMSALISAKALYELGDTEDAKARLQWAIDHASDNEYRQLARLHLAGLLLDQKDYEGGLKALGNNPPAGFTGLFDDRRGDLLVAQNKIADAKQAYRAALEKLSKNDNSMRQFVQFKLDALGG
ncbi:hypothetical protein PATSB16_10940 [Pandoraea thiooxydans]|uniref:Ancillary SecYEG translocon subunit n=1 Tax=Pandoraea thiooxydans TaxID=445709 RepID=A0A0G3EQ47_9BURK|nr:tetratricopeptide repeat protein [Pandoraea thiooxydans]AKJ67412.1 hypothetical protein ABW99_03345 [Pandoraea thiooxydans]APR94436.1 hypothetical protein PATSB16_10940 [Pandoraea thiooxydans]